MKMKTTVRPPGPRRIPRRMVKTLHARAAVRDEEFDDYEGESEPNMKLSHAFVVVLVLHILAVGGVFAFNTLKSRHITPDRTKTASAEQAVTDTPEAAPVQGNKTAADDRSRESAAPSQTTPEKTAKKAQQDESGTLTYTVVAGDTLHRIATNHKTTVEALEKANNISSSAAIHVGLVLKIPTKSTTTPQKNTQKQEPVAAKTAETKPVATIKTTEPGTATKPAESPSTKEETKSSPSEKTYTVAKGDNPYSIAKKLKVGYNDLIKANNIQDPTKLQIGQKLVIP